MTHQLSSAILNQLMSWIILSLLAGLGDALRDAFSKKAAPTTHGALVTWSYSVCALPFFLPSLLLNIPESIPLVCWAYLLFNASCHVFGGIMLVRALHLSDLSLCVPMAAFTPVFLLVVGPLLTGDIPSTGGIIGATLVTLGSYVLNLSQSKRGFLAPFKALFEQQGSRIMLGLSLLWSITASVDRIAVKQVELSFWASAQLCAIAILLIPILIRKRAFSKPVGKRSLLLLGSIGCFNALSLGGYLVALTLAPVHYVVCIKRCSILFSVVLGRVLFKERFVSNRLPGAMIMLAGVIILSLW